MRNTLKQLQIEEATTTFGFGFENFNEELFGDVNTTLDLQMYLCFMEACTHQSEDLMKQLEQLANSRPYMTEEALQNMTAEGVDNFLKLVYEE